MTDVLHVAKRLARLAEADRCNNPNLNDAEAIAAGAAAIRAADAAYRKQWKRAERLARENATLRTRLASLQAELTEERANVRALEAVAARPAPYATEQSVEVDSRGNVKRVVTRPMDAERRPAGFA